MIVTNYTSSIAKANLKAKRTYLLSTYLPTYLGTYLGTFKVGMPGIPWYVLYDSVLILDINSDGSPLVHKNLTCKGR